MPGYSHYDANTISVADTESRLNNLQYEALGFTRREAITTLGFKEERRNRVASDSIQRRIDLAGTDENKQVKGDLKSKLNGWSRAWTALKDDGTAEDGLEDINDGLGQTHRVKLQTDPSVGHYTGEDYGHGGGFRGGRGGGSTGQGLGQSSRGGGSSIRGSGRATKRGRVTKTGRDTTPLPIPVRLPPAAPSSMTTARTTVRNLPEQPKQTTFKIGGASHTIPTGPKSSPQQPSHRQSRASSPGLPRSIKAPSESSGPSTHKKVEFAGSLASPNRFMDSVLPRKTSKATIADAKAQTTNKAEIKTPTTNGAAIKTRPATAITSMKVSELKDFAPELTKAPVGLQEPAPPAQPSPAQPNLMDMDVDVEAPKQPVIDFTDKRASSTSKPQPATPSVSAESNLSVQQSVNRPEAWLAHFHDLRARDKLSDVAIEFFHDMAARFVADEKTKPELAKVQESQPEAITYDRKTLLSMAPTVVLPPKIAVTKRSVQSEQKESLALKYQEQRDNIIGSHIHRSHFAKTKLLKNSPKLDIKVKLDENVPEPLPEANAGKSKVNPFGPAKQSPSGPSLPPHLASMAAVKDHGAAAREQYEATKLAATPASQASKPVRKGPSLPAHLANMSKVNDPGAAARLQYGAVSTGAPKSERGPLAEVNSQTQPQPTYTTSANAAPKPRVSMLNKTGFIGLAENKRAK